jgi:PleD family two-component response regulator
MDHALYEPKRVVLVIDSDQARCARLKKILNEYGYRVYTTIDLKGARRTVAEKKLIDVTLLSL